MFKRSAYALSRFTSIRTTHKTQKQKHQHSPSLDDTRFDDFLSSCFDFLCFFDFFSEADDDEDDDEERERRRFFGILCFRLWIQLRVALKFGTVQHASWAARLGAQWERRCRRSDHERRQLADDTSESNARRIQQTVLL